MALTSVEDALNVATLANGLVLAAVFAWGLRGDVPAGHGRVSVGSLCSGAGDAVGRGSHGRPSLNRRFGARPTDEPGLRGGLILTSMSVMPDPSSYRERASAVAGVTVWTRVADGSSSWILPDGCIDVLWNGRELTVAGPDTTAHRATAPSGTPYAAVRFASGVAPTVLRCRRRWASRPAAGARRRDQGRRHRPARRVAARNRRPVERARALGRATARGRAAGADRTMCRVAALIGDGRTVAEVAAQVGFSERQLNRRSLAAFGYGPKVLARVLRLQRALGLGPRRDVAGSGIARRRLRRPGPLRPRGARAHRAVGVSARRQRGEQVDAVAVRVAQRRVALPPERVPRFEVAVEPGGRSSSHRWRRPRRDQRTRTPAPCAVSRRTPATTPGRTT